MATIPREVLLEVRDRITADIADAEAHLSGLRLKLTGVDAVLEYSSATSSPTQQVSTRAARLGVGGPTDAVLSIMKPDEVYSVDVAHEAVNRAGHDLSREQVRNAIHYLVRRELIVRVARGAWRLRTSDAAVSATAASENTPPIEEGGDISHEAEAPLQTEHNGHAQLGAAIIGGHHP